MHNSPQTKKQSVNCQTGNLRLATIFDKLQPKSQYNSLYVWFCNLKFGLQASLEQANWVTESFFKRHANKLDFFT